MRTGADISPDSLYRYLLWREWDARKDHMVWIMLNPSTADGETDDLTITKCMEFAERANCGGIEVINLYAYRCTQPTEFLATADPEGPRNVETWASVFKFFDRGPVVAAWGDSAPKGLRQSRAYLETFIRPDQPPAVQCLGKTAKGSPRHPSRLAYSTPMVAL